MSDKQVPWSMRDVVVALVIFLTVITGSSFIIIRVLDKVLPGGAPVIAFFIGYLALIFLIWYLAVIRRGSDWSTLGFRPFSFLSGIGLVVGWFFLIKIITLVYTVIANRFGIEPSQEVLERLPEVFGKGTTGFLLAVVVVAVVAPFAEELFFRGFIYPVFRGRWGVNIAIIADGLLFALFHFDPAIIVPIAIIGFVLAYLYEKTNSLGPPIILHALNNFVSVFLVYYSGVLQVK